MNRYRITKYNPVYRDEDGRYTLDEWISVSDIGRTFNSVKLEREEYLKVENAYMKAVNVCIGEQGISKMLIAELEKHSEPEKIGLDDDKPPKEMKEFYGSITEGGQIKACDIERVVQLCLREDIWCLLYSVEKHFLIEFRYDYYMYIICDELSEDAKAQIMKLGLFVEETELP